MLPVDRRARVLCAGGAGFIGANLVRHLVAHTDWRITVLDALTYAGRRESLDGLPADRVAFVHGSITDAPLVDRLVAEHDVIVNLAAESHNDLSLLEPERFVETNVTGTFRLLEAVRRHDKRYHHVSTDEVYGDLDFDSTARFTAESPYRPSSPYAATKASSDLLVRAWVRSFGVRATISTCSNNLGPYQHVEKFIPRQITTLLDGGRARVYGSGRHVRDWIHVDDHCAALQMIIERGRVGATYLIAAGLERSNLEIIRELLMMMGFDEDAVDHVPDRPGHDRRYALDASVITDELGWRPRHTDLTTALADTITWYRDHESWWRPVKEQTEARYARTGQ